jgi:3-keto-disaccharide hydrolase
MIHRILLTAVVVVLAASTALAKEPTKIFNGKDLTGWDGDPKIWSVEDGVIIGRTKADDPLKHNEFLIWKDGEVADFKLSLQYRIKGGNSGVQYRSKVVDPAEWIVAGYQADIDSTPTYSGILYEERERGILAKRGERVTIDRDGKATTEKIGDADELQKSIHNEDWNDYTIEARGPRLKHTINGKVMSETVDRDRKNRDKSGVLAFQVHAGPPMTIEFRKIRYEKLEPKAERADKKSTAKKE